MSDPEPTKAEQDAADRKRRAKSLKITAEAVDRMLSRDDALRRLADISDEEWDEAAAKDAEGGQNAGT
jgi:hypothetical protein